jgi:hypothetical protein
VGHPPSLGQNSLKKLFTGFVRCLWSVVSWGRAGFSGYFFIKHGALGKNRGEDGTGRVLNKVIKSTKRDLKKGFTGEL